MFERTLLPLIALACLELIANLVTFAPFLRPTSTWGTLSIGVATAITFGGRSFRVLRATSLVLLGNAIAVFSHSFPVNQVLHGLKEKTVRLFMGLFGCTVKHLNVILQQLARTDLPKKDVPQHSTFRGRCHAC